MVKHPNQSKPNQVSDLLRHPVLMLPVISGKGKIFAVFLPLPLYRVAGHLVNLHRFRLFLTEILLFLPHSAWAGGNQAEWAHHLGSNGGNNQISFNKE